MPTSRGSCDSFLAHPGVRRAVLRLGRIGALATLLYPRSSHAQDRYPTISFSVGWVFGERPSVEWGLRLGWVELTEGTFGCADGGRPRQGYGPMVELAALRDSRPRVTFGAFAGTEIEAAGPSVLGELGASIRFDDGTKFGLHTREIFETTWPHFFARQGWFLNEYALGGGLSLFPILGVPADCVVVEAQPGRPLRDAGGVVVPPSVACKRQIAELSPEALPWYRDATSECSSVPSFLALAAELLAVEAPLALVHRALDAAEDELVHAELCAEVASALAGRSLRPECVKPPLRPAPSLEALLARLGVESFVDGYLNEGAAAERARRAADVEPDPLLSAVHRRIARDEGRHAELGFDIVTWSLGAGGALTRRALAACLEPAMGERFRVGANARRRLARALYLSA